MYGSDQYSSFDGFVQPQALFDQSPFTIHSIYLGKFLDFCKPFVAYVPEVTQPVKIVCFFVYSLFFNNYLY